jgi:hypothetical protein
MPEQLTREDILALAARHEGPTLEYKVDFPDQADKLVRECAGLANSGGGTLLLGVADDGTVTGVSSPAKAYDRLAAMLRNCDPPIEPSMGWVPTAPDQGVVYASMTRGRHLYKGVFYVRNGTATEVGTIAQLDRATSATARAALPEQFAPPTAEGFRGRLADLPELRALRPVAESNEDWLEHYRKGLVRLLSTVGRTHPLLFDVLTLQARMDENIRDTRLYGDTETKRSERNRLLGHLNRLSIEVTQESFNTLAGIGASNTTLVPGTHLVHLEPESTTLSLAAWPRMLEIDTDYDERRDKLLITIINGEYEDAVAQYWRLIYYTGTRELWLDNAYLSERLLDLSNKRRDYRTVGLLQARGKAWPLMYKGNFRKARLLLNDALQSLLKARASVEMGVFYEYMADMYSDVGNVARASALYSEAGRHLTDMAAHKVELKRRFLHARYEDLGTNKRITALTRLSQDYSHIKSYREGIVQMELARSYYFRKAPEAIAIAESASSLLGDDVRMPTPAARAWKLLQRMTNGQPIEPLFSRWRHSQHV